MTIYSKEYCYLTAEAKAAHRYFIEQLGCDEDLAYALLEALGGEAIYDELEDE